MTRSTDMTHSPIPEPDRAEEIARAVLLEVYRRHGPRRGVGQIVPFEEYALMQPEDINNVWDFDDRHMAHRTATALAALSRVSSEPGWRTIDDPQHPAPSDGSRVLVVGGIHHEAEKVGADGDWWRMRKREGGATQPTHWMPLPAPPPMEGK